MTDPDARAKILLHNIVNLGYNIQAVSDAKHKLFVGLDTGSVNDTLTLVKGKNKGLGEISLIVYGIQSTEK